MSLWMFAGLAAQSLSSSLGYGDQVKQIKAQNKADEAYNKALQAATARQLTEINLQRSAARQQTSQALDASRKQGLQEQSARGLQAAASDTMGASVDQNLADVDTQLAQVAGTLMQNAQYQELSFDSQVFNTVESARNAVRKLAQPVQTDYGMLGQMIGSVGTQIAANKLAGKTWSGDTVKAEKPASISQATGTKTKAGLSKRINL